MRRAIFICGMVLALGGTVGCSNPIAASSPPANSETAATTPRAPAAETPKPLSLLSILSVEKAVDVTAQRGGVVLATEKDEGSVVRTGDEMGRLDDSTLQAELQKAESDLLVSQNNVKYKEAEEQAKNAQLQRQQLLRASGLSSEADLEEAEFEAKGAAYDLDSWRQAVKSNQAQIHELQIEIAKTHISAPFSGVVVHRYIRQGEQVNKNDKCFRVSQLAPLQVEFQVPETGGVLPQPGLAFSLRLSAGSEQLYTARVLRVSPTIDPASDSYDVVGRLTGGNLDGLRPGMSVEVLWPVSSRLGR
ncbi:MAG TPA: efflux RND transporter periplasmic adaptor subunit [Candidatus Acidoferrales bacterium]|nr:efflux RND transporter periplasmic adaptor subunit [Candidatus Acidoferrales bacterium]